MKRCQVAERRVGGFKCLECWRAQVVILSTSKVIKLFASGLESLFTILRMKGSQDVGRRVGGFKCSYERGLERLFKIGRVSRRERAEISVGAVSLLEGWRAQVFILSTSKVIKLFESGLERLFIIL